MEVVQKAVSEAVHAVRNSPLLRRRFGDRENSRDDPDEEPLSPEKDRTPFVQGFTYRVDYLGKAVVDPGQEQDHGCTDHAVELLWTNSELYHTGCNEPMSKGKGGWVWLHLSYGSVRRVVFFNKDRQASANLQKHKNIVLKTM